MRQAISTRYLGPTNCRGSRIKAVARKASSFGGEMSLTEPYSYSGTQDQEHARTAQLLATQLGWSGLWVAGGAPSEDGNVYVSLPGCSLKDDAALKLLGVEGSDWFRVRTPALEVAA